MPEDVRTAFDAMTIKDMAQNIKPAIYAAWRNEIKEQKTANRALRDAAEEAFNAICDEEWEIGMRICAIPAHTLEGMTVKLRGERYIGIGIGIGIGTGDL
ncbi:hypothetical protein NKJ26_21825 [Mesorhizobium sp. M0152]|uniref:hypothetical protein n=1 Tax=Mesorhizobium sp. M0152 TaxID=2956898 RepID=UPI0033369EB2